MHDGPPVIATVPDPVDVTLAARVADMAVVPDEAAVNLRSATSRLLAARLPEPLTLASTFNALPASVSVPEPESRALRLSAITLATLIWPLPVSETSA